MKKLVVLILTLAIMALTVACENPNASKTDKVGSYASAPYSVTVRK